MRRFFLIFHRALLLFTSVIAISVASNCIAAEYSVSKIETRLVEKPDRDNDIKFVIKADVTNLSNDSKVFVNLQAIDSRGFEVHDMTIQGTIHPGSTKTLSDHGYMNVSDYRSIKEWRIDE